MKRVHEGRVYDTDTAEQLHHWESPANPGDFQHYEEALYRTKKGNYFIAGSGGPMSPYAEALGGGSTGGSSGLRPLEFADEAVEWLEEHDGAEVILEHFSEHVEEA